MNRDQYLKFHRECCDKMIVITKNKNADYTGGSDVDYAFTNFIIAENAFQVGTTEQGFFTRLTDKFSRIATFIKKGIFQVLDESLEDTVLDTCNYLILFLGYVKSKKVMKE